MAQPLPYSHRGLSNPKLENSPPQLLRGIDLMTQKTILGRWIGHAHGKPALSDPVRVIANMILLDILAYHPAF